MKLIPILAPVDRKNLQFVAGHLSLKARQYGNFLSTGSAPGSPEGHDDHPPPVVAKIDRPKEPLWRQIADLQFLSRLTRGCYHQTSQAHREARDPTGRFFSPLGDHGDVCPKVS